MTQETGQETDPNEKPLDGTRGGLLDTNGQGTEDTYTTKEHSQEEDEFDPRAALGQLRADPELKKFVVANFEEMKRLEEKRSALNDELKSIRSKIEVKGIPLDAIKIAYKLYKMDLDKVQTSVIGVALCMDAADLPVQIDFLDNVTKIH